MSFTMNVFFTDFKVFNSLLCSVVGLIIDAFGELRDQLEQVKEDMEVK